MRFNKFLAAPLLALTILAGCDPKKDDPTPPVVLPPVITPGDSTNVFVINEGRFGSNNGSVSFFNKTSKTVTDADRFRRVNGRGLGDVVQSMAVQGNKGYIVVNNSNKVEVVTLPAFTSAGVVRGLTSPRHFLPVSPTKAYVTQWGDAYGTVVVPPSVKVVDLTTNAVVATILTGDMPERLVLAGGKVYVANSGSNTLTVIDPATNTVTSTLAVGDAPNSFATDKNGLLWVLCGGTVVYNTNFSVDYNATTRGGLVSVNAATATVTSTRTFATNLLQPTDLQKNQAGDQLLFRATDANTYVGSICRLGIADASLPALTAPFIQRKFYGLGIDPKTDVVYGGTGVFQGTDKLIRYQSNGAALDSATVGVGPNGFVFY